MLKLLGYYGAEICVEKTYRFGLFLNMFVSLRYGQKWIGRFAKSIFLNGKDHRLNDNEQK